MPKKREFTQKVVALGILQKGVPSKISPSPSMQQKTDERWIDGLNDKMDIPTDNEKRLMRIGVCTYEVVEATHYPIPV